MWHQSVRVLPPNEAYSFSLGCVASLGPSDPISSKTSERKVHGSLIESYIKHQASSSRTLAFLYSPDSKSYWGSYLKYRKGCWCAPALSSLSTGAAAGVYGCMRFGAWMLLPLQGAAAECRCRVLLPDVYGTGAAVGCCCRPQIFFAIWGLCWYNFCPFE